MTSGVAGSFSSASAVTALGDGLYEADLSPEWAIGDKPHGGYLLAVLARAASERVTEESGRKADPLAISAQYLSAPDAGPASLRTTVRKIGRTASVVTVTLEQGDKVRVEASTTLGELPAADPDWAELPDIPAEPGPDALFHADNPALLKIVKLAEHCDIALDPATAGFVEGRTDGPLSFTLWAKPKDEEPDTFFSLVAGDINPPVTMNLGRFGWAPTVQLTALLRAKPAPGWLRIQVDCRSLRGGWFDSDATVIDATGALVCQARQLALSPRP
ncbi:thioesterase family protein [Pseudonocardiaceae bacterium YIM PH 21723]|nr:thioesterase family protein [Pseudonocardiaceae bacterium YIM PH 21723]